MALASNGELVDVRVVKSSGDVLFDRSALTAVKGPHLFARSSSLMRPHSKKSSDR